MAKMTFTKEYKEEVLKKLQPPESNSVSEIALKEDIE